METPSGPSTPNRKSGDADFEAIRSEMTSASLDDADRRARIEYLRSLTGTKPKKSRTWLKVLLVVAAIGLLAGGAFWYLSRSDGKKTGNTTNASQNTDSQQTVQPQEVATKHHDSTAFNLGFDYPENWKVSETGGNITVASPAASFKTASGNTQVQVVFMIQSKQSTLPGFKNGNGIAVRTSEKVAYKTPTPNQRAQTYMSFVSNAGSATTGIDSIFVTGDLGYQKDQAVPQADIIQGDPLVSIFFAKCASGSCAADPGTAKVAIADSAWNDSNVLVKSVKNLLLSLAIN